MRASRLRLGAVAGRKNRKVSLIVQQDLDGFDNRTDVLLCASPADAGLTSSFRQLIGKMKCHHKNGNLREELGNLPGDIDSVQIRHLIIQQDQIGGRRLQNLLKGLGASSSLGAYPPRFLLLQDRAQIAPNCGIIID
jgi:hypothetical protein